MMIAPFITGRGPPCRAFQQEPFFFSGGGGGRKKPETQKGIKKKVTYPIPG